MTDSERRESIITKQQAREYFAGKDIRLSLSDGRAFTRVTYRGVMRAYREVRTLYMVTTETEPDMFREKALVTILGIAALAASDLDYLARNTLTLGGVAGD